MMQLCGCLLGSDKERETIDWVGQNLANVEKKVTQLLSHDISKTFFEICSTCTVSSYNVLIPFVTKICQITEVFQRARLASSLCHYLKHFSNALQLKINFFNSTSKGSSLFWWWDKLECWTKCLIKNVTSQHTRLFYINSCQIKPFVQAGQGVHPLDNLYGSDEGRRALMSRDRKPRLPERPKLQFWWKFQCSTSNNVHRPAWGKKTKERLTFF